MINKFSKRIHKFFSNPRLFLVRKKIKVLEKNAKNYTDEDYLKQMFFLKTGKKLDLLNPTTYNEKIQWLKLFDRKDIYTKLVDKFSVRDFVANTIGNQYLIPLIGVWNDPEQIPFDLLPEKFILKCNHNSGTGTFICKNKSNGLNIEEIKKGLKTGLSQDYYLLNREWPYKNVARKILCEELLEDSTYSDIIDYKFFCFDGKFKILLVCTDRHSDLHNDWYDENLNHLPFINGPRNRPVKIDLPFNVHEMIKISEILAKNIPHVRVDLYNIDGKIYFGEMTFFESSGFSKFKPKKYDKILGDFIKLPSKKHS